MAGVFGHLLNPGRNPIPYILLSSALYTTAIAALGNKTGFLGIKYPVRWGWASRNLVKQLLPHQAVNNNQPAPVIQWIYGLMIEPEFLRAGTLIIVMPYLALLQNRLINLQVIVSGSSVNSITYVGA